MRPFLSQHVKSIKQNREDSQHECIDSEVTREIEPNSMETNQSFEKIETRYMVQMGFSMHIGGSV